MQPDLNRVRTFMAVADCGSFTRAALRLGISKALASQHIKALEAALGVPLLVRSPRALALTEAGQELYRRFEGIFSDIEQAFEVVGDPRQALAGTFSLTCTPEFGERFVLPLLTEFAREHPALRIHYVADARVSDLLAERFDLAIRLGTLPDSSLRGRPLGDYALSLVAAPGWLAQHAPRQPEDLERLAWIANSNLATPTRWTLRHAQRPPVSIQGEARLSCNTITAQRQLALAGMGLAVLPHWWVREDLASGALQAVLPDYALPVQTVAAVYPGQARVQRKTRLFIDALVERLRW
ncbi:MAG: HTH-type transcriptional regulator DmlR [Stenotrophomonas maltophilia]|nr:MAG: HTH-type transcriptional regulator DmlR [Stenotrophomonas maltophilia]